ncbi:phosphoenolpyruvate--protein phosphotransferase [Motiliproteus sp. MSK22-1]|uniref:phosphoenolpyruvate--protein phosphotransferase n=1 Tax=Motiliproteus sp. MSK22-1 TaxID=1897630 RepID=UPI0009787EBA|nr:phosphoenolpyruvate--protein phosphotransferase [Motiliproteus sp. MSK22-1]OMH33977.1 phosphoenolpyruvate--protein phosphotransferase [Motiliproteus sp. MSK22-1]
MQDKASDKTAVTLSGRMLSPGLGSGKAFLYRDILGRSDEFYDIEETDVIDEIARFTKAVNKVSDDLKVLADSISNEMDDSLSDVFYAHITMVQDNSLTSEVEKEIKEELVSAGTAVKTVFRRWERRFQRMEMEIAKHKADDVHDLARRLIGSLAGVRFHALESLPEDSVLIARRLLPSDTIFLARRNAAAALLEYGGAGSHAALFAREIGLPCITGVANVLEAVTEGAFTLVNADAAEAIVDPDQRQQQVFKAQYEQLQQDYQKARKCALKPALTGAGQHIKVYANVVCAEETQQAVDNGADGIGLYRIEQAYLGRQTPPDAATLMQEVHTTLEPAKHLPVYVRLLDVGADKPLPFMESLRETNPALGLRGIRFLHAYPDLLQTQLDVLLQLNAEFDLHILVPMVTLPEDMQSVRKLLAQQVSATQLSLPKIGTMVETPAAALSLPELSRHADFLSFGTNDLTQYTFAADRENADVEQYFNDAHEVIFRLLDIAHKDLPDAQFSVCGELAGRAENVSRLIKCGVTTLSVAPPLIPAVKQAVRES